MARKRWSQAVSALLVAGATAVGIPSFAQKDATVAAPQAGANARGGQAVDVPVSEVKPGALAATVEAWGILEAVRNQDVYNMVEGRTVIVSIVPEGTKVRKDEIVCELDSAELKDRLTNQAIAVQGAEAAYQNARITREAAELAVREYEEGVFPQQLNAVKAEIADAQAAVQKAEERRDQVLRARKRLNDLVAGKGDERTAAEIVADLYIDDRLDAISQTIRQAKAAIEQAEHKLNVLTKHTRDKTIKELRSEAEKARSDELARQSTWELENSRVVKLKRQIAQCWVVSPGDGVVVYANDPNRFGGVQVPQIEEGATVRERQKLFSVPDPGGPIRVNVKVPESSIAWVTPGLKARVKVEAFEGETLPGVVERIAPLPDPADVFNRVTRLYTTHVILEKGRPGLASGMTARVEFLTPGLDDVLTVPASSVVFYDGPDHVAVKKPDGGFDWREVTLGLSGGTKVEVKEGLRSGEAVAIEPTPLLSGGQKLRISLSPPRPPFPRKRTGVGKAEAKGSGLPPALRTKLQNLDPEIRARLKGAGPEEREAALKKAGFTDDEVRRIEWLRVGGPDSPR